MRHRVFAVVAAVAAGAVCLTAPALARGAGSGGHGGATGHAGFAGRGAAFGFAGRGAVFGFAGRGAVFGSAGRGAVFGSAARRGTVFAPGTATTLARSAAAFGFSRAAGTGRGLTPIRPEVINVPATLGIGGINPAFNGTPIVPPFGTTQIVPFGTGASYAALPVVTTPYAGVPAFAAADASRLAVSRGTLPADSAGLGGFGVPDANPVDPNALHGTCHPVPHGYHCDWSS